MNEPSIDQVKSGIRLTVGITILAVLCISALGIVSERRDVIASAERLAAGYSRALSEHSESAFSEADAMLRELLRELQRKGGLERIDHAELFQQMRRQLRDSPQVGTLFIADRRGVMRINSDDFPSRQINVADREYFRSYLSTPGLDLSFGEPLVSRLVQRRRFNLMRPLNLPGDPFAGLIALGFEAGYFNKFFRPESLGLRGAILLVRNDGVPLVYEPYPSHASLLDFRASKLFTQMLPRSDSGVYHVKNDLSGNHPLIVGYQRLTRFPIVAVVSFNEDDVLAPWYSRALRQSGLTLGLCLVILILARLLFRHLNRLQAAHCTVNDQQAQLAIKAAQIDAAQDSILQVDPEGRLVHFNQALCRLTGYSEAELTGRTLHDIEPPEFASQVGLNMAKLLELGQASFESAFLAKNGAVVPVEVQARVMERDGRRLVLSIARDITQRRRAELRERNRLKTLERIATGVCLEEMLTCIVHFVEQESRGALCSVLLADDSGTRLRHGAAPSLPEEYNKAVDGLLIGNGHGSCGTAAFLRRRVVVEDLEPHPYWKRFQPARDAALRACWSEPVCSPGGTLLGTVAIYHRVPALPGEEDILLIESAAHLASIAIGRGRGDESRRALEEQLRHSQRIEAVGQLAAGVAHDFNNLLTPIIVYTEMLRRGFPEGDPQVRMVDAVSLAAHKASELTQKLLSFGRKQLLNMAALDLNEVICSFGDIMRTTVKESICIDLRLSPGAAQVHADRGQLEQILLNLMVNAQDAIAGTGTIRVETGHLILDEDFARQHPGAKPGHYVMLAFSDDGCGMEEATLNRIYEPFFTTKQVGRGTGLGLATVHGIVKHHEGYINVKSRPGEGTRFDIYLPAGSSAALPARGPGAPPLLEQRSGQGRTVLLVEDNAMIREMAGELLTSFGYRTLCAATPSRALELARRGEPIELLATDVVMPEMSGPDLYDRLLESRPGLPVLYISGYSNSTVPGQGALADGALFLAKPFTLEQFMDRVGQMIGAGPLPEPVPLPGVCGL